MFEDISIGKILFIALAILLLFGPKRIPDIAQSLGKGIREFKKAMKDVSDEVQKPMNDESKASSPKSIEATSQAAKTDTQTSSQPKA